ncbi:hypothetical protein Poli38472_010124 [Pythium oligandrum]|uniref:Glycerophosphodiester phosphodiesterase n=1 Tax=Pythium oligandrum TaxID=41045 RepID=A0A8K1C949_PYTOL|nr:hypothetical protein Poli38472_010124 [Pythium oligandrum]|eukprot:TMW58565.1 hypothetical protein Poli38472_010124 [Pythium oligandrum]
MGMEVVFEIAAFPRQLKVNGVEKHGNVFLLGNTIELGAWDTTKAVPLTLVAQSEEETSWRTSVLFTSSPVGFPVEYKYIVKDQETHETIAWEAIPGNRTFTLTTASNVACGKVATQSSTFSTTRAPSPGDRSASLGNNGNHNGFQEWRCCRTTREASPWWQVDLGASTKLSQVTLWKGMTYHEQPKHPEACPPASLVAAGGKSSVLPASPLWIIVSEEEMQQEAVLHAIEASKTGVTALTLAAFRLEDAYDQRTLTLALNGVSGRYVRLQHESISSVLQFAELEVFVASEMGTPASKVQQDGVFGFESRVDGDLHEYVDSEWVDPSQDKIQLRLSIGSFRKEEPAIQFFDGVSSSTQAIRANVRYEERTENAVGAPTSEWSSRPVDARGAALLDKESGEFRQELELLAKQEKTPLDGYLNSSGVNSGEEWLAWLSSKHLIDPLQAEKLRENVKSQTFGSGDILLSYGQHHRVAFFVREGNVRVSGPSSATGDVTFGTVTTGSAINDFALFSIWPKQNAVFTAVDKVVVDYIPYDSVAAALDEETLLKVRQYFIRERHSNNLTPTTPTHFVDGDHAQFFRMKLPPSSLSTPSQHRIHLDFYSAGNELRGSAFLLPSQVNAHGEGSLTLPIFSSGEPVGQVAIHFLLIRPFVHIHNSLASVWRSYWRERIPLNGGHRGMGRSFNQVGGFRKALTRENTLTSFILAGRSGADFVEFDVQLTKDKVPVLYHDFFLKMGLEDQQAWTQGTTAEEYEIGIHDMTLRQLQRAQTTTSSRKSEPKLKQLFKKHRAAILSRSAKTSLFIKDLEAFGPSNEDDHITAFHPLLKDLLTHVPQEIGLNIEIKYPNAVFQTSFRYTQPFAMNSYVDTILQCVFDHAGSRRIFFSCFDPELVVLLRAKQAKYPVLFLTYGRVHSPAFDPRLTLQFAANFAAMERMAGVVSNSDDFLVAPEAITLVKRKQLVLLTWGDQNTSHEFVQHQKRHAIDGVISDNMLDLTREDKKKTANAA